MNTSLSETWYSKANQNAPKAKLNLILKPPVSTFSNLNQAIERLTFLNCTRYIYFTVVNPSIQVTYVLARVVANQVRIVALSVRTWILKGLIVSDKWYWNRLLCFTNSGTANWAFSWQQTLSELLQTFYLNVIIYFKLFGAKLFDIVLCLT